MGPKTAAQLINEFGTLENILANAETIRKPSIKESIIRNTERLKKNYQLIKLNDSAILPFPVEELIYHDTGITTNAVLKGIGLK